MKLKTTLLLLILVTALAIFTGFNNNTNAGLAGPPDCTSCMDIDQCNGFCNDSVSGGCFWDGDSCEPGNPTACSDCNDPDTCELNSFNNSCSNQVSSGCFWVPVTNICAPGSSFIFACCESDGSCSSEDTQSSCVSRGGTPDLSANTCGPNACNGIFEPPGECEVTSLGDIDESTICICQNQTDRGKDTFKIIECDNQGDIDACERRQGEARRYVNADPNTSTNPPLLFDCSETNCLKFCYEQQVL